MRRYGIFVFYNEQGIVGSYIEILLKNIRSILEELVIVVNGEIKNEERKKLYQYSNYIFQRSNTGYDGGAYKDVFLEYLGSSVNWEQWDEIVLHNDTFYGPFFQWNEIFSVMEQRNSDFWGLSRHPGGISGLFGGKVISPHLQSYFIVLKKNVFTHPDFLTFWKNLEYPQNFREAVMKFEIQFSDYLVKLGFNYETWMDVQIGQAKTDGSWDFNDLKSMFSQLRFPILKRKRCVLPDYINLKNGFHYIAENTEYPVEAIYEDIRQRCKEGKIKPYNPEEILRFFERYKKIYLYGKGIHAKNIEKFVNDNGKKISGYILSRVNKKDDLDIPFGEFKIKSDEGLIVSLSEKNFMEVYRDIKSRIPSNQVMFPLYDET